MYLHECKSHDLVWTENYSSSGRRISLMNRKRFTSILIQRSWRVSCETVHLNWLRLGHAIVLIILILFQSLMLRSFSGFPKLNMALFSRFIPNVEPAFRLENLPSTSGQCDNFYSEISRNFDHERYVEREIPRQKSWLFLCLSCSANRLSRIRLLLNMVANLWNKQGLHVTQCIATRSYIFNVQKITLDTTHVTVERDEERMRRMRLLQPARLGSAMMMMMTSPFKWSLQLSYFFVKIFLTAKIAMLCTLSCPIARYPVSFYNTVLCIFLFLWAFFYTIGETSKLFYS